MVCFLLLPSSFFLPHLLILILILILSLSLSHILSLHFLFSFLLFFFHSIGELVQHNKTGLLFNNAEELADHLLYLLCGFPHNEHLTHLKHQVQEGVVCISFHSFPYLFIYLFFFLLYVSSGAVERMLVSLCSTIIPLNQHFSPFDD